MRAVRAVQVDGTNAARRSLGEGRAATDVRCVTELDLVATGRLERSQVEHVDLDSRPGGAEVNRFQSDPRSQSTQGGVAAVRLLSRPW